MITKIPCLIQCESKNTIQLHIYTAIIIIITFQSLLMVNYCLNGVNILASHKCGTSVMLVVVHQLCITVKANVM